MGVTRHEFQKGVTIVRLTHISVPAMFSPSPFTEGVPRRRSVGGAGRRRPHLWLVTTDREAGSPSGPDEGPAFSGLDNIGRRAAPMLPGSREVQASGPGKEDTVVGPKNAPGERRKGRLPVTRQGGGLA